VIIPRNKTIKIKPMQKVSILILFISVLFSEVIGQESKFSAKADLNSDKKPETIKLEKSNDANGFKLIVNDKQVMNKLSNGETEGFNIIDIDVSDKYKEIAVYTSGDSEDYEYILYWYNGEQISLIGNFLGQPVFNGNGIVYLDNWMGFWKSRDKLVIDKTTRKPQIINQFAYYVGVKAKVKNGFAIYQETALIHKVAVLSENTGIELLLCDKTSKDYFTFKYLIKSESGLIGWANLKSILDNTEGLPTAD
jgi:hypothetical protein